MGDSQSRYGIMEELNNRKISEKEKLANIERETDNKNYEYDKAINALSTKIAAKKKSYILEHKDRVRTIEVNIKLLEQDYNRKVGALKEELEDENKNYKARHEAWVADQNNNLNQLNEEATRYTQAQNKKIADKKEVIAEIESGIASLKEISKDQKGSE